LIPGNAPCEKVQLAFVEEYFDLMKKAQNGSIHLLFGDPSHLIHNTIPRKCWQRRGEQGTLILSSNTGRRRISILGGINAVNHTFTGIITEANCDQEVNKAFLKELRKEYSDKKKIVLILDNAKYNRATAVQEYAEELNIEIIFLPPYCPNLNLIERIWKLLKKKLSNKYIENFDEFYQTVYSFCSDFHSDYSEIKTLIGQKFQIIKAV
jgi:transposase